MGQSLKACGIAGASLVALLVSSTAFAQSAPSEGAAAPATSHAQPAAAFAVPAPSDPAAPAPPPTKADVPSASAASSDGPEMRVGGMVNLGLATRPLGIEAMWKYRKILAVGLAYNLFPGISVSSASVGAWQLEGDFRVLPTNGSFFLGAGFGYQSLNASAGDGSAKAEVDIHSLFVAPRLGWLWTWDHGFTLGFDLGANVPLGASTTIAAGGSGVDNVGHAKDAGNLIGNTILPDIKLRIGWLQGI